jgi:hydrogenase nickel incorporation protein HypA/HybF
MHELSLAGGILRVVEDAAAREHFRRVKRLTLEAGALCGVELRSLRFALEAIAPGTCLEGARLEFEEQPGQAWCMGCCATVQVFSRSDACPRCGSQRLQSTGGTDLKVRELIVHDD